MIDRKDQGERFIGLDMGTEYAKIVELTRVDDTLVCSWKALVDHQKMPGQAVVEHLVGRDWSRLAGAAACGRFNRDLDLPRIPVKQAQLSAVQWLRGERATSVVSIGSHGFSVLECRAGGNEIFRENSRCSQGTGNFLRQLVERFNLDIDAASAMVECEEQAAPLSGRCPVILKTDMTHLANKGESRSRILAGLYDAVCENVQVLVKPRFSPPEVMLIGGMTRSSRIRGNFKTFLDRNGMTLVDIDPDDAIFFEALGCALLAAESPAPVPSLEALLLPEENHELEAIPALSGYLSGVKRLKPEPVTADPAQGLVLGFDIGSTGSKVVALAQDRLQPVWEAYVNTNGQPVAAAQNLMRQFSESAFAAHPVVGFGATGSGREIVGSLLATCYGSERVYILNEIVAHAEGALYHDPRVDTIFEIGGQDAKYARLANGRVVDAAMNEACSAGTGSFIEEQGRKFSSIENVVQLGGAALEAEGGVSLGQHCSVFMAEVIDEAVASGVKRNTIIAGIYDSIIQNYLNRVKGSRTVGQVVFCQGMPFAADALAAAVVRQTGAQVVIPPSPGTVGSLGIALLANKNLSDQVVADSLKSPIDPARFLEAEVTSKDNFICKSTKFCGGSGNKCRIDRITTTVDSKKQRFTWGGGCSLWDQGTGGTKLPDNSPDIFRAREELMHEMIAGLDGTGRGPRVAISEEFMLKGFLPFFATFLHGLGLEPVIANPGGQKTLKRGIEQANVPFCAPMQLFQGVTGEMADLDTDYIFVPMLREIPKTGTEPHSVVCPIAQASPDMLEGTLGGADGANIISPVINFGEGRLDSPEFIKSCADIARAFGLTGDGWRQAMETARAVQLDFQERCLDLGRMGLEFAERHGVVSVVVLGRPYTIHNTVLNSNVPAILRDQGALAIPVDCYPVAVDTPPMDGIYWGYSQRSLRAAWQVRRTPGVYTLWCSNYSCGPDSFNLHFYGDLMQGKPYAVIETDGHSGDAGTKTRVEAFLHCVAEDHRASRPSPAPDALTLDRLTLNDIRASGEKVVIPRMGIQAEGLAAAVRGAGVPASVLAMSDNDSLRLGRRHTSGKECLPVCMTLGSMLHHMEKDPDPNSRYAYLMATSSGPCRFGCYSLMQKSVLHKQGLGDRVRLWSPNDDAYGADLPAGFRVMAACGIMGVDLLLEGLYDTRPRETEPGAAQKVFDTYLKRLTNHIESIEQDRITVPRILMEVATSRLFGISRILREAAKAYAAVKTDKDLPTVLMVGEIYVRADPAANGFLIERLEKRGLRVRFAPIMEWMEYSDFIGAEVNGVDGLGERISRRIQVEIQDRAYRQMERILGWPARTRVPDILEAARPYVNRHLLGEAVLTVGGPTLEWRHGHIDGVVSVAPLECMPGKISEAQLFCVGEKEELPSMTIYYNGDPVDPDAIDTFAFEIRRRFREKRQGAKPMTIRPGSIGSGGRGATAVVGAAPATMEGGLVEPVGASACAACHCPGHGGGAGKAGPLPCRPEVR